MFTENVVTLGQLSPWRYNVVTPQTNELYVNMYLLVQRVDAVETVLDITVSNFVLHLQSIAAESNS